ncbi:MAG: ATP-binding protein [Parvibaculum sp.]|uniref:ATP-binding protein n=1 Tax=Parvibaculum sp. TaxID=2024848 RepID=UPI00271D4231|nr:ATP-binding protein [Parvibaculum sp.]MDO8838214.1 ATP-binding protein [Parvibaculum sp.]
MHPPRPDPAAGHQPVGDTPDGAMGLVVEAFGLGRWSYDLLTQHLELHSPTFDTRNVARRLSLAHDAQLPARTQLRRWLESCAAGSTVTEDFALPGSPIRVRILCTERSGTTVRGLMQDCSGELSNAEGDLRFRMALKGAAHGIALVGLDGGWLQVNDAICDMLQYSEKDLLKLTFQDITHPDDLESDLDLLHECIEGKRNTYQMEKRYFRSDGEIIWVHLAVAILRTDAGEPLYFVSQIQDITAQKRIAVELVAARDAAKHASAAKDSFLASMSHEIRTPMTGVMGMLDMLELSGVSGDQLSLINTARSSAEMLLSIINDVLDMAKLEAGRVEIAKKDFYAETLLRNVCDMMAARAEAKGLAFNAVLPLSARVWLKGDPDRISQILFNLIGNAVKFTDTGEVSLAAETRSTDSGLDLVLHVRDTGRGIPADKIGLIFKEFEQANDEDAQRMDGTGLGLAIVSRLVEAMGGKIDVRSEPGRGSVFSVQLPLAPGAAPAACETGRKHAASALAGRRVLVVEDNEINRKVIGSVLDLAGIDTTFVFDGAAAVEKMQNETFDLILMDLQMPVMDGLTATRKLREMGVAIPILALTANAMAHDREACFEVGMDDHIGKPFRPAALLETLAKHLG